MKHVRYLIVTLTMFTLLTLCGCGESPDRQVNDDNMESSVEEDGEKEGKEDGQKMEVYSYTGDGGTLTLENDHLLFEMDGITTYFTVQDRNSGTVWYSNPESPRNDSDATAAERRRWASTLLLTYENSTGEDALFDNSYSINREYYQIEEGKDERGEFIKVFYSIGAEKAFSIPEVISEVRMKELMDMMDAEVSRRVEGYYKKYDINKLSKKDDREELLALYPMLENEVIYVLRPGTSDAVKEKLESWFEAAGYTYEDSLRDKANVITPDSQLNISMIYRLEGNQLSVEIPVKEMEYQKMYFFPIQLEVLPCFGTDSRNGEGDAVLPEGGSALIQMKEGNTETVKLVYSLIP